MATPPPRFDDPSAPAKRWRLWSTRLWILAAILAAATLYSFVSLIHDKEQRRAAARVIVTSAARDVMSIATARMEVLALGAFAPLSQTDVGTQEPVARVVESLARRQRASVSCNCREVFPVEQFFGVDIDSRVVARSSISQTARDSSPSDAALLALAAAEARNVDRRGPGKIHLSAGGALRDKAALTVVETESSARVYGLIGPARDILQTIFLRERDSVAADTPVATRLDLTSLQIASADGTPLLGALGDDHPIRATIEHRGALEGLQLTVALAPHQIPHPLLVFISPDRLWHNGALILCTVVAVLLALGASRREILLARARSDFIAGVSHDLRMPLAQILLASETLTLRRERDEQERMALTSSIVREAQRLIALVENVLLFTRSGRVQLRAQIEELSVDDLLADVVDSVHLAVADAEQTIERQSAPDLAVLGDRQLLRQALVNLVDNAIKYGASGQRITLAAASRGDATVHLYVDDRGPGIPPRDRQRVFEPYERLARDQVSERSGSGLGLAVVRQIAQACHGSVWIDDAPGGGTRVVFELQRALIADRAPSRAGVA